MPNKKVFIKIVIIGDTSVGKTSLLEQYTQGKIGSMNKPTIGADFTKKTVLVDKTEVTCQIWDTAGQERFQSLGYAFYRGADCCCLVYDITNPKSFESLDGWRKGFVENASPQDPDKFPFILIGNKLDKESDRRVSVEEAKEWCKKKGEMPHFEASAKEGANVEAAFVQMIRRALKNEKDTKLLMPGSLMDAGGRVGGVRLTAQNPERKKKKGCKC